MRAACTIREHPSYRADAFKAGLRRVGYSLVPFHQRGRPDGTDDLLVLWNVHRETEGAAADWEKSGGTVIVCENGYIGTDSDSRQYYAISVGKHNGAGWTPTGSGRFDQLGIAPLPLRETGEQIVVRGQRCIGAKGLASPPNWHFNAARALQTSTRRPVRVVPHPGNREPKPTGEAELAGAWACAIWSSSMGVRALMMGIPVAFDSPHWICDGAGQRGLANIESLSFDDASRAAALERMAWGQWSVAEIERGEPFARFRADNWGRT